MANGGMCPRCGGADRTGNRVNLMNGGRGSARTSFPTGHNSVSYWVLDCGHLSVGSAQLNPGSSLYLQALSKRPFRLSGPLSLLKTHLSRKLPNQAGTPGKSRSCSTTTPPTSPCDLHGCTEAPPTSCQGQNTGVTLHWAFPDPPPTKPLSKS